LTTTAPTEKRSSGIAWDFTRGGFRHAAVSLCVFGAMYAILVVLGLTLHEYTERLTILWPASGLLYMALWLSPARNWPWIILVQLAVELLVGSLYTYQYSLTVQAPFSLANSVDGLVGAFVAQQIIETTSVPRLRNVLLFFTATALGSATSAIIGAFVSVHHLGGAEYAREWQLWWVGNWLGSLCVAPILMSWVVRLRAREHSAPSAPAVEMMLIGFGMLVMTAWVFSAPPGGISTILDMPFVMLAFVVAAAFRMPPRWAVTLASANALLVAYFSSRGLGPFAGDPSPFVRVGAAQLYLATLVVVNFLLCMALLERRNAYLLLRTSDERYRNFIEHSSEAVWRIELREPMDPQLPLIEQIAWLRSHAYIAESNLTYQRLNRQIGVPETDVQTWRTDAPWAATFIEHLGAASHQNFVMDGLQFTVPSNPHPLTFMTAFRGVLEEGKLVRIWGVARDVTELVELNERLRQKQERLRSYARELVGAEERARRATAVDLHDGIGQQLVGLQMTLNTLVARSPPEIKLLLSEATATVREIQTIAQRVIADLSPPGLYELGLEPALKWLSVYVRSKDGLQVDLYVSVKDGAIDLNLRVLAFKVIRELLRNVVKHAGVRAATVTVTHTDKQLRVVVEDKGVGFEWQLSLFEPRQHGFGLWSIADRVRDAAGEMVVDTAPGHGCRVTLTFPLGFVQAQHRDQEALELRGKGAVL
jgi:signal transduction histidine kinase